MPLGGPGALRRHCVCEQITLPAEYPASGPATARTAQPRRRQPSQRHVRASANAGNVQPVDRARAACRRSARAASWLAAMRADGLHQCSDGVWQQPAKYKTGRKQAHRNWFKSTMIAVYDANWRRSAGRGSSAARRCRSERPARRRPRARAARRSIRWRRASRTASTRRCSSKFGTRGYSTTAMGTSSSTSTASRACSRSTTSSSPATPRATAASRTYAVGRAASDRSCSRGHKAGIRRRLWAPTARSCCNRGSGSSAQRHAAVHAPRPTLQGRRHAGALRQHAVRQHAQGRRDLRRRVQAAPHTQRLAERPPRRRRQPPLDDGQPRADPPRRRLLRPPRRRPPPPPRRPATARARAARASAARRGRGRGRPTPTARGGDGGGGARGALRVRQSRTRTSGTLDVQAPHRIVATSGEWCLAAARDPLDCESVQFVSGIAVADGGDDLVVSYGVSDCEAKAASVPLRSVWAALVPRGGAGGAMRRGRL